MQEIRWGILGTGYIAGEFAEGLRHARGSRLQAVASRSLAGAAAFAAGCGKGVTAHGDYAALCADPAVDIVYVGTPNEYHLEHCLLAIDAGKHVLCEKPFALDAAQGRRILEAASARGVFCMEGMWTRCSPALQHALGAARGGTIGELRMLSAQMGATNVPSADSRLFRPPGGGALLDLAVYPLALAQAVFGAPSRVFAAAVMGDSGVDEQVSIILEYAGGRQASIGASIRCPLDNSASIHGTHGRIHIESPLYFPHRYRIERTSPQPLGGRRPPPGALRRLIPSALLRPLIEALRRLKQSLRPNHRTLHPHGTGMTAQIEEVTRCLQAGLRQSPLMSHADTLAVLDTLDTVRRAWQSAPAGGVASSDAT